MKDKLLRCLLYGKHKPLEYPGRSSTMTFPAKEDRDITRQIKCSGEDGLILYFLKRIEKLEIEVEKLKVNNKSNKK